MTFWMDAGAGSIFNLRWHKLGVCWAFSVVPPRMAHEHFETDLKAHWSLANFAFITSWLLFKQIFFVVYARANMFCIESRLSSGLKGIPLQWLRTDRGNKCTWVKEKLFRSPFFRQNAVKMLHQCHIRRLVLDEKVVMGLRYTGN